MKVNRLLSIFLVIGILFSTFFVLQRGNIENEYKNVEITIDYNEILKMAVESDKSVSYFLNEFKDMNITSVSVNEMTLNSLKEREDFKIKTSLDGYDLVVEADSKIFNFILEGFKKKIDSDKIHIISPNTLRIDGSLKDYIYDETNVKDIDGKTVGKRKIGEGSKLEFLGIGFLQEDIDLIKKSGLNIIPRPMYISQYDSKKNVVDYFNFLDKQNINPNFIIFAGKEVLGGGKYNDYLNDELKNRNIIIGMIETEVQRENIAQRGIEDLVQKSGYNATRVFNIAGWIQERYDYEMPLHRNGQEVINSMYRAVTERNIRIVYFRPFIDKDKNYVTDMSIYKDRFKEFENRISAGHKLKIGSVNVMNDFHPNRLMHIPIIIGVIASFLILMENIINIKDKYTKILFMLGSLGSTALYFLNIKVDLLNKMFALLGSITMPSLAMAFIFLTMKEILKVKPKVNLSTILIRGIMILAISLFISFMGVLFEVSLLSDIKYLLEMDIFKGVKLSQIGPILLTILIYISVFGYKRDEDKKGIQINEIISLLKEDIKVGHLILLGIIGIAGIVFIARTGHETNIKPSTIELLFRNMLELALTARPRTKAFLLAHPALMLMVYCTFKNKKWAILPLSIAVVLGQGNVVNTFSHLRAPLYLSYIRTNYETLFGIILGLIIIVLINFTASKLGGRKGNA